MKTLVLRGVWMLLGYALAVLVATTIACIVFGLPTVLPDDGRWGSFYTWWRDFPSMLFIGGMMTAIYGLPGWLGSVILAEWKHRRSRQQDQGRGRAQRKKGKANDTCRRD